jgi:hypothetical protein
MRFSCPFIPLAWAAFVATGLVCLSISSPVVAQESASPPAAETFTVMPTPINEAEAIIEPFWEPVLSGLRFWAIQDGIKHGLQVKQTWASVEFYWSSRPETGPALSMTRAFNAGCSGYDRLLVAAVIPEGGTLRVIASTDTGNREYLSPPAPKEIVEHVLDLQGASRIVSLTLEIATAKEGPAVGWFKWIGVQNTRMLPRYLARWDFSHVKWEGYLQDETYEPQFKPLYGIFLTQDELDELRAQHQAGLDKQGKSPYTERSLTLRAMQPEKGIHEFVWSGGRRNEQHGRVRDESMAPLDHGYDAALTGLVLEDKGLLRLAARYALSVALSDKWDDGFLARFPGSAWELRSFRRSYCSQEVAEILDLAGEMFTEAGRIYVMRRLAEEGIGPVNFITWRFDYLFQGNQLAFVTRGRLYAYLVMERAWPRVKPYTDIAYQNVREMFSTVILRDGGSLEPPSYFGATVRGGCEMLRVYARARHQDPGGVLPDSLRRTGDYGAAIASTLPDADVIPVGDSGLLLGSDTLLPLAYLAPKSCWTTMLRKRMAGEKRTSFTPEERQMLAAIPRQGPPPAPFVALRDTGHMASTRALKGPRDALWVKIFIPGNRGEEPHSHEHEDRGSFVLEFGGEALAIDPGVCDYEDPLHQLLKQCQYHNMLVPVGAPERPGPEQPIRADVKPVGKGNRKSFHARMNVTRGWNAYYKKWVRSWDSPSPETLVIRDEYELAKGNGVEFYWQTKLPCRVSGRTVSIKASHGSAILETPSDCSIRIDALPAPENTVQNRIAVCRPGPAGVLQITVRLRPE